MPSSEDEFGLRLDVKASGRAKVAAASLGGDHTSHPDHVGRVSLIDLGGTSARSPRFASGLCGRLRRRAAASGVSG
jgi:hypothetical protein